MLQRLMITGFMLVLTFSVYAQHNHIHEHSNEHKNHVGIGVTTSHLLGEKTWAPGFHLHYIHQIGKTHRWGMGAGYEVILDEHSHNGLNLLVNYRPMDVLSINAGPGIAFAKHAGVIETMPAFHAEAVLEFSFQGLHWGPMIGFGADSEDSHISAGLHLSLGF